MKVKMGTCPLCKVSVRLTKHGLISRHRTRAARCQAGHVKPLEADMRPPPEDRYRWS